MEVKMSGQIPICSHEPFEEITVAGGNLFLYEKFGSKADPRGSCGSAIIPGGAWVVDPDTGQLLHHYAPQFHFTDLIPDRTEPVLYGLAAEGGTIWEAPVNLVRMDARNGRVLQSRQLDVDYWWIAVAPLQNAPTGEVQVVP
jgi:hypothetical protein